MPLTPSGTIVTDVLLGAASRDYADGIAGRAASEVFMPGFSAPGLFTPRLFTPGLCLIVATIALLSLPAGGAMAQSTPNTGPAAATAETPPTDTAKPRKKRVAKKMTQQQEIDKSVDSGTVPARYRSSVPKEYHHLIPFDKR